MSGRNRTLLPVNPAVIRPLGGSTPLVSPAPGFTRGSSFTSLRRTPNRPDPARPYVLVAGCMRWSCQVAAGAWWS